MSKRRDIRRLAMQILYQIDLSGETDRDAILAELDEEHDPADVRTEAADLALSAWQQHGDADKAVSELAPDWPTHRQPPVDRAILRLAYHEILAGRVPAKVAINEAVEIAKRYAGEGSPAFINGVLDKLAKQLDQAGQLPEVAEPVVPPKADVWLSDAVDEDE